MSLNFEFFSLIIFICFSFSESNTFCEQTDQSKSLVDSVFSINEDIYLIRGQDFWVSTAFSKKPDPTARSLKNKFLGFSYNYCFNSN